MEWEEFINIKDKDAYKRLFTEMLIINFNDILPRRFYQYHVSNVLKNNCSKSALKLKRHKEAIDWLLSDENFKYLVF